MIKDPVIGEEVLVKCYNIGGPRLFRVTDVNVLGDVTVTLSPVIYIPKTFTPDVLYRVIRGFAGPIAVTWRDDDPTPRSLVLRKSRRHGKT